MRAFGILIAALAFGCATSLESHDSRRTGQADPQTLPARAANADGPDEVPDRDPPPSRNTPPARRRHSNEEIHRAVLDAARLCEKLASTPSLEGCISDYADDFLESDLFRRITMRALNDCLVQRFEPQTEMLVRCVQSRSLDLLDRERALR